MLEVLKWAISDILALIFFVIKYNLIPINRNLICHFKRVHKLLEKINISKAAGPDLNPGRMFNILAPELAPIVHAIFTLDTEELPRDWSLANVAPIFKKDNRGLAENYRPVSLTCITCKLFEHIVCRHILDHVEDHKILTNLQHGFRSGRSCETQLIVLYCIVLYYEALY